MTIAGTVSGSPAANAGLAEGDTITAIGGQSVNSAEDISHALVKYHPGDSVSVTWVDQSGQSHTIDRDPGERPGRLGPGSTPHQ